MTVLYIAFGFVALWLLAEVLMQYKARLRWRLLAFAGFLGVVAGVILPSVPVIGAGALAFAVGQTLVTLSFRKGFVAGWALRRGGEPVRQTRRRRAAGTKQEPALQVTDLQYDAEADRDADAPAQERPFRDAPPAVYSPEPVPDESGSYGIQSLSSPEADGTAAFASPFTTAEQDAHQYAAYYDQPNQGGYDYSGGYPVGDQQQVYAAYSDPYIGTGGGVAPPQPYDYTPYADYGQQQYSTDTPPGGVWVPQQRSTDGAGQSYPLEDQGEQPQQYPYPQQGGYEQYRY
ncbi:hypothetical protein DEJ51_08740 [Streptomyces venezuelae]|uniref:Uncharacterized protein n=2 Tax=Streptomyces venezuelae TaxID=54571 RepID=A0A5P2DJ96_STRVZ|nr:hypothetical protein DEJ51_08740 [Streptomyces venezuelae]